MPRLSKGLVKSFSALSAFGYMPWRQASVSSFLCVSAAFDVMFAANALTGVSP
jgi:hypothetical protein